LTDEHIVDILHFKREVVQPGAGIRHAKERVMIDIVVNRASIRLNWPMMFSFSTRIDIVRADQTESVPEPLNRLLIFGEPSTAWPIRFTWMDPPGTE